MNEPLNGCRILVVEDEMLLMMQTTSLLMDLGCVPMAAATIQSALAMIAAARFDAAMLDVNLGGTMSFAVADALIARGVPFLFATGYADASRENYADRAVLRKPFRAQQLTAALENLVVGSPAY